MKNKKKIKKKQKNKKKECKCYRRQEVHSGQRFYGRMMTDSY